MSYTCSRCGATSHHPEDERYGYCGRCHDHTRPDAALLTAWTLILADLERDAGRVFWQSVHGHGKQFHEQVASTRRLIDLLGSAVDHAENAVVMAEMHKAGPGYFGEKWDAPVTDDAAEIPTPVGARCMHCREAIAEGDQGTVNEGGWVSHKECSLRGVMGGIGHLVDHAFFCHGIGPDAGLSYRRSARLVWRAWAQGERFTRDYLIELAEAT